MKLTMVCSSPSPPERLARSPGIPGEEVADKVVDPELELPASSFLLSGLKEEKKIDHPKVNIGTKKGVVFFDILCMSLN